MIKLIIICLLILQTVYAETDFASPKPSIDNPRKIVFPLMTDKKEDINHLLSYVNNVMKVYRPENVEIAVVTYSKGVIALLNTGDSEIQKRIKALMTYDVEFLVCMNTINTLKLHKKMFLDNVTFVEAGLVELIERQKDGWVYIRP